MSEREWDSADSDAHQDRVEAGEITQDGSPREPGLDEWGQSGLDPWTEWPYGPPPPYAGYIGADGRVVPPDPEAQAEHERTCLGTEPGPEAGS